MKTMLLKTNTVIASKALMQMTDVKHKSDHREYQMEMESRLCRSDTGEC